MKKETFYIDKVKSYGTLILSIFFNFTAINKNKYKYLNIKKQAFTLIELIIVISILAILATIAFISFKNYSGNARDSNRLSTIKNIETGLELFTLKTSQFPIPDKTKTYTGSTEGSSQLNQGIIGEKITKIISLSNIPLDPKDKTHYIYSTFGNNKYFQVGINTENTEMSLLPQTYAQSKKAIIKGNYIFDPSLPSLILVENETLTNSGIFSPEVCFVMNNGKNSLYECHEEKNKMNLKDYDNSLIGYWDMETLFNSGGINYLKDLSGNNNYGGFSGTILPTLTGGILGSGHFFTGSGLVHTLNDLDYKLSDKVTVSIISKTTPIENMFSLLLETSPNANTNSGSFYITDYYNNICGTDKKTTTTYTRVDLKVPDETTYGLVKCPTESSREDSYKIMTFIFDFLDPNNNLFYENGKLIHTFNHSSHNIRPGVEKMIHKYKANDALYIGKRGNGQQNVGIYGIIDDIKIYNRALTSEEIFQQAKIAGF